MLSPPPKRSMIMPPSPFSRLSRNQRSIPSLLPPPPSRGLNASPPSKLMRLSGAILDRYSRSPLRAGSLRRLRRSLSRTYARSPMRNWTKINPLRTKRITGDKFRRSISPLRNRSLSHQRKTLSHGKERSASPRRNFVKSQVRSVKRANNNSRSISRSPYDGRIHRHESPLKDGRDAPDRRESWSSSPARSKKQFSRSFSSDSKSVSRTPNRSYKVRRSRSSSKNSVNCEGEKINRRQSPSEGNASFHRRSSASSHRRNSLSLRRNFYQSPGRGYSRDQSPPLNFVRTRLLGRTPPSPPVRNSKTPEDVGIRNVDARPKSASKLRNRSNERRSKSRSYDYRHSSVKSGRGSAGRTSRCESFASSGGDGLKSGNKNNASFTSSQSSSRSTSSSCSQNIEGHHASSLRSPEKELDKSKNKRYAKQIVRKGSAVPELMHNRSGEKRSHSVDSSGIAKKKVCLRSKGGPRSPPGSPELKSEIYSHAPSPKDVSPQKRSLSSKSRNSNCPSDRSHKVSTGRKTPLAYQCPRESISPPARKREFLQSRSPLSKSPHHHSMRKDAKARPIRHTRENSKHARHVPHTSPSKEPDRFKRDFSRCPPAYHDRSRSRYFKSPPPPMDHRHFRALDEMSMRLERSRPPYYNDHHVDTRAPNYYRRADYLGESEKGYYRRLSPPTHLPPPPPPQSSYPYRRVSDIPYQRSSRIRCEDLDQYYRTSDPFRGRIHNPPIIYRSGTNPVYSRQRPYRR